MRPVNLDALELKYAYPASGYTVTLRDADGNVFYRFTAEEPTENDVRRAKELISSLSIVHRSDRVVFDIVYEEAQAYFAGQKTVEEVTAVIQNRVKIYAAEQFG